MTIKNLDRNKDLEFKSQISSALKAGDEKQVVDAFVNMAKEIENSVLQEAKSFTNEQMQDESILASRGFTPLTKEEKSYYNEVISGGGFAGVETLVPATIIERVFEDLAKAHPLLNEINFVNTGGVTKWVVRNSDTLPAWWGKLCDDIKELIDNGFETLDVTLFKLSAFIPVCKAMLELGPVWLDRYVRAVLTEASAVGLEQAIINGTGKDQPIGIFKDLEGAVVDGVFPDKTAGTIADLTPLSLGKMMADLSDGGKRKVGQVIILVNPLDYYNVFFPATTVLTQNGTYAYGVLPIDAKIIESVEVPVGKFAVGMAKDYFMGVGSSQKITVSDEARFIEDERVYVTRMLANGRPRNNASFKVYTVPTPVA